MIGGGIKDRGEPDALHPQTQAGGGVPVVEIVKAVDDAPQVADAVPVGVGEGAHEDLVEDAGIVLRLGIVTEVHIVDDGFAGGAEEIETGVVPGGFGLDRFCGRCGSDIDDGRRGLGGRGGRLPAGGQQEQQGQDQREKGAAFHENTSG